MYTGLDDLRLFTTRREEYDLRRFAVAIGLGGVEAEEVKTIPQFSELE